MTPRDLSKCAVGQAKYVLICDSDGGIINDPVLTRMDENTFWFALASSDALLFARGLKNAYPDLDVTIKEADVAPLQVQGPKSKDLMVKLLGDEILDLKYYYWTDVEDRRRAGGRDPHRLDVGGGLRGLPHRHVARERGLRGHHGGRRRVRHQADRAERHPPHRGRHLQLGRRHDLPEQRVRARASTGSSTSTPDRGGLHLDRGATGASRTRASPSGSTASSSTAIRSRRSTT